jgi:RNA polymerase sigma factor (sigma-70 family)
MIESMNKNKFLTLILENKKIIYKICHSYCNNPEDREDLVQEIIIHLWNASDRYDPKYKLSTWMYRIALNVAISFYRVERRRTRDISDLEDHIINCIAFESSEGETEKEVQQLYHFISELDELNRALMLLYLDSHSYKDMSDILGISETNVASKVSRIKKKLKQSFLKFEK